jgi:sporulation protein YqfC
MRSFRRKVRQLTSELFDLPQDVALNVPRMTLVGSVQLYVENHRGVSHFSDRALHVKINNGELRILGEQLKIRAIYPEEVLIEGRITSLSFKETGQGV